MSNMEALLLDKGDKMNTKTLMETVKKIENQYSAEGITKENLCSLVMTIFSEVNKYKKLTQDERKEIIIAITNSVIRKIDEGETDSDLEVLLISLVPNLVDSVFITINSVGALKKLLCCSKN